MSTILKALRQAEKESPDAGCGEPPRFNSRTTLQFRMQLEQNKRFKGRFAYALFIGLFVLIPVGLYWYFPANVDDTDVTAPVAKLQTTGDSAVNVPADARKDEKKETTNLTGSLAASHRAQEKNYSPPKSIKGDKTLKKEVAQIKTTPEKVPSKPLQQKALSQVIESSAADTLKASPPEMNKSEKRTQTSQRPENQRAENRKPDMLTLTNQSFKIQAIFWANDRRDRFAVINNTIVNEGDDVQDYRLVQIEKGSVILIQNGQHYRMKFKYR